MPHEIDTLSTSAKRIEEKKKTSKNVRTQTYYSLLSGCVCSITFFFIYLGNDSKANQFHAVLFVHLVSSCIREFHSKSKIGSIPNIHIHVCITYIYICVCMVEKSNNEQTTSIYTYFKQGK